MRHRQKSFKIFVLNRYAVKEVHEYDISTKLKSLRDKMLIEIKSVNKNKDASLPSLNCLTKTSF